MYIFNRAAEKDINGMRNNHQAKKDSEVIRIKGGMPAIVSEDVFDGVAAIYLQENACATAVRRRNGIC